MMADTSSTPHLASMHPMPGLLRNLLKPENLKGFPSRQSAAYTSGTVWPHGEFSYGYVRPRGDGGEWHENPYIGLGVDDVAMAEREGDGPLHFDLSDLSNSHIASKRGLNGITGFGQQMTKAAGYLLQERYPHHRKTLGTVTLPEMSRETRRAVVAMWSELTRELLQWLSRRLERQGLPPLVCSVTEVQPRRLQQTGQACLHWHLLWLNRPGKKGNWAVEPSDVRAWLDRVLRRKLPSYQGGFINVDTKPVDGKVAAYLAKYMSKGKQAIAEARQDWGDDVCPSTWWNMTESMRGLVKRHVFKGRVAGEISESIVEAGFRSSPDDYLAFLRHIEVEYDGVRFTVGWRGRFLDDVAADVRAMLESLNIERLGTS